MPRIGILGKKSFIERHPNPSHFKPSVAPREMPRMWGRSLSPFWGPPLCVCLIEEIQQIERMD